jgi:hypothetical protein
MEEEGTNAKPFSAFTVEKQKGGAQYATTDESIHPETTR